MPKFSKRSASRLAECHPDLQLIMNETIKVFDFAVICGYRGKTEQDSAYSNGYSKLKYPQSKHNKIPSQAVDIVPYYKEKPHIRWKDIERFKQLGQLVEAIAAVNNVAINWGGRWTSFKDYPHFELVI